MRAGLVVRDALGGRRGGYLGPFAREPATSWATPHLAGMTQESRKRMGAAAAEDTLRMLAGERPLNLINPEAWSKFLERRPQNH